MERVRAALTAAAFASLSAGGGKALDKPAPTEADMEPDFGPVHAHGCGKHHGGRPGHNERDKKAAQRAARKANRRSRK